MMHVAKASGSDRVVLDGLIQAVSAHEFLFGRVTDCGRHGQ